MRQLYGNSPQECNVFHPLLNNNATTLLTLTFLQRVEVEYTVHTEKFTFPSFH